jgi:hypothetical protein
VKLPRPEAFEICAEPPKLLSTWCSKRGAERAALLDETPPKAEGFRSGGAEVPPRRAQALTFWIM